MKKIFRSLLKAVLILLLIAGIWNYRLVAYGFRQLYGQLTIILNSKPIDAVLQNPGLQQEYRDKLHLAGEIRKFAMDSIGLKNSKNYTTYFDQHEKPVMWVVTGCLPYELKAKEWWFPFLGNVSYKGFFNEDYALQEAFEVQNQGYETDIYSPSAWSTLGFFKDPVFSNMLKRSPGRLAELLIHELTHATIYLESSVEYNENLATFIGEKGAEAFLVSKYGLNSDEYNRYKGFLADEEIYSEYMMMSAQKLDSLYQSFGVELPVKVKARQKYRMIATIMSGIKNLPLSYPERYRFDFQKSRLPNNTEFVSFLRYRKKQNSFNKTFSEIYKNDLKAFIGAIVRSTENNEPLPF